MNSDAAVLVMGRGQVSVPWPHSAISLSQLRAVLMPADGKQLLAPDGSAAVSAADLAVSGREAEGAG